MEPRFLSSAKLERREFLKIVVTSGLFFGTTSCAAGSQPEAQSVPTGGLPKKGGTLTLSGPLLAGSFDPLYFGTPIELFYAWPAYNALIEHDPVQLDTIVAGLAETFDVSEDGRIYTFRLRKGVEFHDGGQVTAEDVKYTYEAIMNPPVGVVSRRRAIFRVVEAISTPDQYTVIIRLKYPSAAFLGGIASVPIVPKRLHEKGPFTDKAIGTGPFRFVRYQKDIELVYERNERYWRKGLPYLDQVRILFMTDTSARFAALRAGRIDADFPVEESAERILKSQYGNKIELVQVRRLNVSALLFNHELKDRPWSDRRVRQAMSVLIDRAEFINTVWGGRGDVIGVIPNIGGWALGADELKRFPGYSGSKEERVALAKKLLADAGYPDGFRATLLASTGYLGDIALYVQAALRPAGIHLELVQVDEPTMASRRAQGNFELAATTIPTSTDDPDEQLSLYVTGETLNFGRYSNPRVDELYEKQSRTLDKAQRKALVDEISRILLEDVPLIMLQGRVDTAAYYKYVRNLFYHPSLHFHFTNSREQVWLDK